MKNEDDGMFVYSGEPISINQPVMPFNISFINAEGKEVGKFIFEKDVCTFEGNADESAKVFIDFVKQYWADR